MRVTDAAIYRNFLASLETTNERLDTVSQQLSSGKRLVHLSDAPDVAAESVLLMKEAAELDQYQANADSGKFYLQVADSALNSVQNLLITIQTDGIEAASGTASTSAVWRSILKLEPGA